MPVRVRFKKRPRQPTFVRQWRVHRGLSQEQLAERLQMSAAQLSLWDHAKPGQRRMIVDIARTVTKTGT
jgi:transcriptional regulator with XRE-family HTH domain